jgi:hypothetical protein
MNCNYTCFDRILHLIKPLETKEKLKEAKEVYEEFSFSEFLDFLVEQNCFTEEASQIIYAFIVKWENLEDNYWEKDPELLRELLDAIGLTIEFYDSLEEESEE